MAGVMTSGGCAGRTPSEAGARDAASERPEIVVRAYQDGRPGVRTANPDVKLSIGHDPVHGDEPLLIVDYPPPGPDPAGRDVVCDVVRRDWSSGRAIAFRIKPSHAMMLSVSFMDRNRVVYTAWRELKAGVWQPVSISFDEIQPNPYFQPGDARTGAPIDVSQVTVIAFAPQDRTSGRLAISRFTVLE
jgi:hypothetical protein